MCIIASVPFFVYRSLGSKITCKVLPLTSALSIAGEGYSLILRDNVVYSRVRFFWEVGWGGEGERGRKS